MMPTPFTKKSRIDFDSIDKLVELAINTKCHGIVTMGVMGEAHRLTENERNDVIKHVSKRVNNRIPITVGVSGESIEIVSQRVKESNLLDANYILCSPPKMSRIWFDLLFTLSLLKNPFSLTSETSTNF